MRPVTSSAKLVTRLLLGPRPASSFAAKRRNAPVRGSKRLTPAPNVPTQTKPLLSSSIAMTPSPPTLDASLGSWRNCSMTPVDGSMTLMPPVIVPAQTRPCSSSSKLMTRSSLKLAASCGSCRNTRVVPASRSSALKPSPNVPTQSVPARSSRNEVTFGAVSPVGGELARVVEPIGPGARIPFADAVVLRANPEHAAAVLENSRHGVVAEARDVGGVVAIAHEIAVRLVEQVQAGGRADPEPAVLVLEDSRDSIARERRAN